jgi:hypothetical protein
MAKEFEVGKYYQCILGKIKKGEKGEYYAEPWKNAFDGEYHRCLEVEEPLASIVQKAKFEGIEGFWCYNPLLFIEMEKDGNENVIL